MNRSKRAAMLLVGVLLVWVGLCEFGPHVPLAGERQAPATDGRAVRETRTRLPAGSVELRCRVEQPTAILSIVPPGESVKEGDLLVELDAAALIDKRISQVFQVRKADAEVAQSKRSRQSAEQIGQGQIYLAEKALRLAESQLKAFTDGEYPHQLDLAEGALAVAQQRLAMAEARGRELQMSEGADKGQAPAVARQEADIALLEAKRQFHAAERSLTLLKSFVHDNKVAEMELVVAQRQFELTRAKSSLADANMQGDIAVSLAQMNRQMEADRLAKLDDQITKCKIYAPQDGTVDQPRDADEAAVKPGAVVRGGQLLVRLLPVKALKP